MEYHQEHWSWSTCREQRLFAVFEIYSFLSKHPSRKKCFSSDLCIFCLLSSTKSVPMYLVPCWKNKQSHIFILPCRNDPSQLQNCRTKRVFHGFWDFACDSATMWRNSSSRTPKTEYVFTPQNKSNVMSLFRVLECFIRFETWGTAPLQRLCQNMVRTWYGSVGTASRTWVSLGRGLWGILRDVWLSNRLHFHFVSIYRVAVHSISRDSQRGVVYFSRTHPLLFYHVRCDTFTVDKTRWSHQAFFNIKLFLFSHGVSSNEVFLSL